MEVDDDVYVWEEATYRVVNGEPEVLLFSRNYNDKFKTAVHVVKGFEPYFYAPAHERHYHHLITRYGPDVEIDAYGREVRRCYTRIPSDVPKVRDMVDGSGKRVFSFTDMADFLFEKRFLVDKGIKYAYKWDDQLGSPVPVEVPSILMPRIVYFDIEVLAPEDIMPLPNSPRFPVVSIQVKDSYTGKILVFTYGLPAKLAEDHLECFSERKLFQAFITYLKTIDPDIVTGWNISAYDVPYLVKRAQELGILINGLGRFGKPYAEFETETNKWNIKVKGRGTLDMIDAFKKLMIMKSQRESYALKEVSKDYGFPYDDYGPKLQRLFDNEEWETFLQYCRNDVISLETINNHPDVILFEFYENLRMICGTRIDDTLYNSKLIEMYLMHNRIKPMPTKNHSSEPKKKFEGAYVMSPPPGVHENVGTVDLAALYPTIMRAFPDETSPDIDHKIIDMLNTFVNKREILRELRKSGDNSSGTALREYAYKVLANSVYGVVGSPNFRLFKRECAEFVTSTGRTIIHYIQEQLINKYMKTVIYGDSVIGASEVKIYDENGNAQFVTIESLFTKVDYIKESKEYCNLDNIWVESIDNDGKIVLDKVSYIMRHLTQKKLYKLSISNCWNITVTEDHSLYSYAKWIKLCNNMMDRFELCKPDEIGNIYKNIIVRRNSIPSRNIESLGYDIKFYEYLGYHLANGSLIINKEKTKFYYGSISFGDDDVVLYNYFIPYLKENRFVTSELWKDKRGKNDYKYSGLKFIEFITDNIGHYHDKKVPQFLFSEKIENIQAFIRGYYTGDGTVMIRSGRPIIRVTCIHESILEDIQKLMYICGIPSSYFKESKSNSYKGKESGTYSHHLVVSDINKFKNEIGFLTPRKQDKIVHTFDYKISNEYDWTYTNKSPSIETLQSNCYVYDLSTEKYHRYFVNNILTHNTDSSMFSPISSPEEGLKIQDNLNKDLLTWGNERNAKVPFSLKFEKWYRTLIFKKGSGGKDVAKKKYCGHLLWEEGQVKNELNFKGIELKRSDQSKISKECLHTFLDLVLMQSKVDEAIAYVRETYKKSLAGQIPYRDASIPKMIRSVGNKSPHKRGIENTKNILHYIIPDGVKPRLLYLKGDINEICIDDELELDQSLVENIDWEQMTESTITKKMKSYIESLGHKWDVVIHGQTGLEKFQ